MNYSDLVLKKKLAAKSAWVVFILCSVIMCAMTYFSGWTGKVIIMLSVHAAVLTVMTFHPKISVKVQSTTLMIYSFMNIFTCSLMEKDIYPSVSVFIGAAILIAVYKNVRLLITYALLIAAGVCFHIFGLESVSFDTAADISLFIVRMSVMFVAQFYLIVIIKAMNESTKALEQSVSEARLAERYKSDFLANMSHEIRTPMNAIVGMCELILRENGISESVRENCFNIQTAGRSLLSIINDILDFSKIESGKMELVCDEFNIASTLNDVINMTESRKSGKPIELIVNVSPDIPRGLIGDEGRIRQIMINIMTNAVKFTEHGRVTLTVSHTKQEYGINLVVSVADTGIGITEENIEKLFTSFRQVDTKKNRSVEGTGLGLAISKSLVTAMGGFISVKSEYGRGTEFRFAIPLTVSDPLPFVTLNDPDGTKVAVCFALADREYYEPIFSEMSEKLGVEFIYCENAGSLSGLLADKGLSHIFVSRSGYIEHERELCRLAEKCRVFVVQERADAVNLPENIRCVYKPFYAISVASALNNENLVLNLNERRSAEIRFTAPKARVLIVDDNVINLKVAVGLMRPYNMQLITAQSGPAAIRMLRSADIDLVFMDHMMPDMDGVEATRIIRSTQGDYYKKLPIIALTANAVSGAREMFIKESFNDFLAKPIELSALDRILRNYLPKEYIRPASVSIYGENDRRRAQRTDTENSLFDTEKGLTYTGGDIDTYREIVELYVKKSGEKLGYISALFDKKDWKNYAIEVHALKSTSLTIGAVKLSQMAKELEAAAKAGAVSAIEDKNDSLLRLYEDTVRAASEYLGSGTEKTAEAPPDDAQYEEISRQTLEEYLNEALAACDGFDSDALVRIAERTAGLALNGKPIGESFEKAAALADDFEYDAARQTLEGISELCEVKE